MPTAARFRFVTCVLFAGTFWPAGLAAQGLVVVDKGGTGQFTEIQPAIDAANPGDIVRVLPAATPYLGFRVEKALAVLGGPGVSITGSAAPGGYTSFNVRRLPAGAVVVIHGFREQYSSPYAQGVLIDANAGAVHFSEVQAKSFVTVNDTRQVSFDSCVLQAIQVQSSSVLFEDTDATGYPDAMCNCIVHAAIFAGGSRVTIAGGTWTGSAELFGGYRPAGPGIILQADAKLTLTGDATTLVRGGQGSGAPAISLFPNAELILDPDPQLLPTGGQPPIFGLGRVEQRRIPYLRADLENGALVTSLNTLGGAQIWLFVSPFSPPFYVPGLSSQLWVGQPVLLASGTMSGNLRGDRFPLPPLLPGGSLPLQAVVWNGAELALSNAAVQILAR